jgi:hypothetical protein
MNNKKSIVLVAKEDSILVGFISLETSGWKSLSGTTMLMVCVLFSHQGTGINNGIYRIELTVLANSISAIGLCKNRGYIKKAFVKNPVNLTPTFWIKFT